MGNCKDFPKNIDFYGEKVEFTFKNKTYFQTYLGGIVSIFAFILMMTFLIVSTIKLLGHLDPYFSSTNLAQSESIDLVQLGFMFAIRDVDPTIGTIHAQHTQWGAFGSGKESTEVQLVDCRELLAGGQYEGQSNNPNFNIENMFQGRIDYDRILCPIGLDSLKLVGNVGS